MKKLAISLSVIIALYLGTAQVSFGQEKDEPIKPIEKYKIGNVFKFNQNAAVVLIKEVKTGKIYVLHKNLLDPKSLTYFYKLYLKYGKKLTVRFRTDHGHVISWIDIEKIKLPIKELPEEIKK
ncbi:hypothetical protein ACFLU5_03055 [Bacteroidota bacterium]